MPTSFCRRLPPLPACRVINCAAQAAPAACEGEGEAAARAVNVPSQLLGALQRHEQRHGRQVACPSFPACWSAWIIAYLMPIRCPPAKSC